MRTKLLQLMMIVGLALAALTACGGSGSDDGVASVSGDSGSDADSNGDAEQEALEWARCMRDEGVDVPDPTTDEDGNVQWSEVQVGSGDIDPEAFQAAMEVCGQPPGIDDLSEQDQSAMQDAALEFAECMRDKGYDVPDPDFSHGGIRMEMNGQDFDTNDPQVQRDMNECQESFDGLGPGDES